MRWWCAVCQVKTVGVQIVVPSGVPCVFLNVLGCVAIMPVKLSSNLEGMARKNGI